MSRERDLRVLAAYGSKPANNSIFMQHRQPGFREDRLKQRVFRCQGALPDICRINLSSSHYSAQYDVAVRQNDDVVACADTE